MNVTYGADYSAGELSPSELESFKDYDIRFLIRYIGWPGADRRCNSERSKHRSHARDVGQRFPGAGPSA